MKKKTIAIDMDGVIADNTTHYLNWYEKEFGEKLDKQVFDGVPELEGLPNGAVRKFLFTAGFFRTLPVMLGAPETVQKLMDSFDVYIVSAAMEFPHSLKEKYDWLQEHFPFIHWRNIIFCGNKGVIGTDYMIDDHVKNLDCCQGKTFIFSAGHNVHVNHHTRVKSWAEVLHLMQEELKETS
ncbi:MAG TPA: 5'(3')-deoxyribonucleotidase [Chitinophagaceae bacterium]|nr:5'(3')-deoxyribonucleotidase [Chitinophagaceae bacterium]